MSLQIIEEECFLQTPKHEICPFYEKKWQEFQDIAKATLKGQSWIKMDFPTLINLLEHILLESEDVTNQLKFHEILAKMIGDKMGRLSPLAVPFLLYPGQSRYHIKMKSLRISFNENCTYERALEYVILFKKWYKVAEQNLNVNESSKMPCVLDNSASPCCGYIGKLVTENMDYVQLVMNYGIPGFINNHSRLIDHLGFKNLDDSNYMGMDNTYLHSYIHK